MLKAKIRSDTIFLKYKSVICLENLTMLYFNKMIVKFSESSLNQNKGGWVIIRGIRTLDFSQKTTNAVLSDLQIVDVIK